ncbi:lytic murein transglycosylase [Alteromonas lipolytica]|uniref:Lytic transglycosylase n=1 Tax=Alteromonas lipolytica TaxID=1856405 RepID=A0A1E8FGX6_9ALTE|nr:lytic murein transglycosylase [Alteromonas lipolytica]OFI34713.1 lytic transglycosylase [Alteromonas lipolytica]GGF53397.1 murein transglycosylase [Alteromonas lipolytica]
MRKFVSLLLCFVAVSFTAVAQQAEQQQFEQYKETLKAEAVAAGFGRQFVENVFATIYYRATVVKADKNQPESKITLDKYLKTRVPDWKVTQAVTLLNEHHALLTKIGKEYGVQPRFIVALWGNESNFGRIQGSYPVLSALASLAFEGRREALFKKQFMAALTILQEGHIMLKDFNGSWAGAMGQSQFIPTSFLQYAVDYDGDGRKDIWNTPADVFTSIANFLASEGWQVNQTWGRQVSVKDGFNFELAGLAKANFKPLTFWQQQGVRRFNGKDLPAVAINASLIMPDGKDGRIYLVYQNFHTLMKWNRSSYFGISVSYLSERIKQGK